MNPRACSLVLAAAFLAVLPRSLQATQRFTADWGVIGNTIELAIANTCPVVITDIVVSLDTPAYMKGVTTLVAPTRLEANANGIVRVQFDTPNQDELTGDDAEPVDVTISFLLNGVRYEDTKSYNTAMNTDGDCVPPVQYEDGHPRFLPTPVDPSPDESDPAFRSTPSTVTLEQSAPNPTQRGVIIPFGLPTAQRVQLDIYDAGGRLVHSLVNATFDAGYHRVHWDGTHSNGHQVGAGVYFYVLKTANTSERKRMVVVR